MKHLITAQTSRVFTNAHVEKDILKTTRNVLVCNTTNLNLSCNFIICIFISAGAWDTEGNARG
jgi:hypothetical protein